MIGATIGKIDARVDVCFGTVTDARIAGSAAAAPGCSDKRAASSPNVRVGDQDLQRY